MSTEPEREVIEMEESSDGSWEPKEPGSETKPEPETTTNPKDMADLKKGAEIVDKAAKHVEKTGIGVEAAATLAYSLRSERLQNIFDWFSEDTQRDLLRADDRTFIMKFIEKWAPSLDWRSYNYPKDNLRGILTILASVGVIDVKPEILKDMRGLTGMGVLDLPDPVIAIGLDLLGLPEAVPLVKAVKSVGKAGESIAPQIRESVMAKVEAHKVEAVEKEEHDKEVHAAGIDKKAA